MTRARANKNSHTQLNSRAPSQAVLPGQGSPRADGANQRTFMSLPSRVCETECGGGVCARVRVLKRDRVSCLKCGHVHMYTMHAQVEIIANTNLGTHTIAALKGDFTLGPSEQREGVGTCRTVNEVYESTKYQGALLTSKILKRECVLTYLGDQVAVKRGTGGQGGGVFIYKRLSQADASKDIQVCYVRALMIYLCARVIRKDVFRRDSSPIILSNPPA